MEVISKKLNYLDIYDTKREFCNVNFYEIRSLLTIIACASSRGTFTLLKLPATKYVKECLRRSCKGIKIIKVVVKSRYWWLL